MLTNLEKWRRAEAKSKAYFDRLDAERDARGGTVHPLAELGDNSNIDVADESPEERAARENLCRMLQPRLATATLAGLQQRLKASHASSVRKDREALEEKYRICFWALVLYLFACSRGELETLLRKYREAGLKVRTDTHPLTAILRGEIGLDPDRANRWGSAIRYAMIQKVEPGRMIGFMHANGGIEGCVDKFQATKQGNEGGSTQSHEAIMPTARSRSRAPRVDRRRAIGAQVARSGRALVEIPIEFGKGFRQQFKRLAEQGVNMRAHLTGRLSKTGQLTLNGIEEVEGGARS